MLVGKVCTQINLWLGMVLNRYVRPLILALSQSMLGCNIGGLFVNVLVYADDMMLLAPSWHALQELIKILEYCCIKLDIVG